MKAANKILFASSQEGAQTALQQLYQTYPAPACYQYFDSFILPNLPMVAAFALRKKVTFGMQSTQRSESIHALLKRDNKAYRPLTIHTTALELVTILHNAVVRHEEVAVETDSRAKAKASRSAVNHGPAANSRPDKGLYEQVIVSGLTAYASEVIYNHFQAICHYDLVPLEAEDDGIEEWNCVDRDRPNQPPQTVTINRLESSDPRRSNIMVCTCDMPSNYMLPCAHVMAVNQHVFHEPVILALSY
jgi:hypothetical protein